MAHIASLVAYLWHAIPFFYYFYKRLAPTAPSGGSFGVDILFFDNTTMDNNDTKEDPALGVKYW